jgi:exopolysaccharide biosynthesis polyprenyl glycosylphosphotransferase
VYEVRGFAAEEGGEVEARPRLGTLDDLPGIATRTPVDEVWLLPTHGRIEELRPLIERCESMGITVHLRLTPFERMLSTVALSRAAGADYLTFSSAPKDGAALAMKRGLDVAGAALLLALLWPILAFAAILVRLTSRGPAVFRQERAGMSGRSFTLYKLRTMREGAEDERGALESRNEMDGPVFKLRDDPRVTRIGRLLRRTSIDELPQLWNVLKGDMSLVGPRPLPVYEVARFEPWQRRRMSMRPGITGPWQVAGRSGVVRFSEWMRLDLEYVDRWSPGLDLRILARTVPAVLAGRGAH